MPHVYSFKLRGDVLTDQNNPTSYLDKYDKIAQMKPYELKSIKNRIRKLF